MRGGEGGGDGTEETERVSAHRMAWGLVRCHEDCEVPSMHVCPIACLCTWWSMYVFDSVTASLCHAGQTGSTTRSRLLHDKVTSPRLRATSAVIHLCQEKTGVKKEGLRQDSDRQRTVTGGLCVEDKEGSGDN